MDTRGSSIVMVVFLLVLVSAMGIALLFLTHNELKMNRSSMDVKRAFYLAEAAIEDGRRTLFDQNGAGPFADDLDSHAGSNDQFDLNAAALRPIYSAGELSGFDGIGDDVPLRGPTALDGGLYAAFLTNDPAEPGGRNVVTDANNRVMLTGIGIGPTGALEVAQAIIEPNAPLPPLPRAGLTLLGPSPSFASGSSSSSVYSGIDCGGSVTVWTEGDLAPTVGAIGSAAETAVESGVSGGPTFTSGPYQNDSSIADLTDAADPLVTSPPDPTWSNCPALRDLIESLRPRADHLCVGPGCTLPAGTTSSSVTFVDNGGGTTNDYTFDLSAGDPVGYGLLVVTGKMKLLGTRSWEGIILVVGQGIIERTGAGSGFISGTVLVADIAGPDGLYGTADDCTSPPDGFGSSTYQVDGGGNGSINYCSDHINAANLTDTYRVVEFLQR